MVARTKELKESLVAGCRQCLLADFEARICTAFLEPAYQFRHGRDCWGKCEDPLEMARRLQAIADYASTGAVRDKYQREAETWRQVARLMEGKEAS